MGFTAANQAEQLKRCYPHCAIPQPSDVLLTRWSQDPFAYGRYSFPAMGSTPTKGAYLSGIQAAKAMLA